MLFFNSEFLQSLCHESKEVAVQQLLLHLPLLHPGNDEARHEYLKLLPKILSHSLEYSIHEEECRQLLSLALVHPAFVPEERNSLTWWLGLLEERGEKMREKRQRPPPGFNTHSPLSGTKSACELWGNNSMSYQHAPITSSLSHKTALGSNVFKGQPPLAHTDSGIGTSFDNGKMALGKGKSFPLVNLWAWFLLNIEVCYLIPLLVIVFSALLCFFRKIILYYRL